MVLTGHISNKEDVIRVNTIASDMNFDVFIHSMDGNSKFDAKSFVCLFTLIGQDVKIVVDDNIDYKYFKKMVKKMGI